MQISFAVTAKLISAFVFAKQIVQFLYFRNLKFPASNHPLTVQPDSLGLAGNQIVSFPMHRLTFSMLIIFSQYFVLQRNGADYCVYLNTASEFDGSDSGARPDEAVSWGKIKKDATPVKVWCSKPWCKNCFLCFQQKTIFLQASTKTIF